MRLSTQIKNDFDLTFKNVKKRGVEVRFSADTILTVLTEAGISPLDAIDILYDLKEHLFVGISTKQILKHVNRLIQEYGYDDQSLIKGETTKPILVEFKSEKYELGFKVLKRIVREELSEFRITSKTFRDLIDEMHRNILAMEKWDISQEDIERVLPTSLRNVIGVNPFSADKCMDDYQKVIKLHLSMQKTWVALPTEERYFILYNFLESAYRVILLSFNYIPGHILNSVMVQINTLLSYLSSKNDTILSDNETRVLASSIIKMNHLIKNPKLDENLDLANWSIEIDTIYNLCNGLISSGSIRWIAGRDNFGRELFSFNSVDHTKTDGRSTELISSAIYGIEARLNEITKSEVQQLDQGENTIVINNRNSFSLFSLIEKPITHLVRKKLDSLCEYIEDELSTEINSFKGNITPFQSKLSIYIKDSFSSIFKIDW